MGKLVPRVSVILPTYNRARLLRRSLASVLGQTYRDFEVRVVDDGSTDDTEAVVAGLADPRLAYARIDHRGVAGATNYGVRQARGEWVAFIDSDDEWVPHKLERQLAVAATLSERAGVLYASAVYVDDATGRVIGVRWPRPDGQGRVFDLLLETNWFPFVSVMARRRCFEVVGGFDERLSYGADRDWLLRAARQFEFYGVAESLVRVHLHHGPQISQDIAARIAFTETVLHRYAGELRARPALCARKYVTLGQLRLRSGDVGSARRAFMTAMRVRPLFLPAYFHLSTSWGPWRVWHAVSRLHRRWRDRREVTRFSREVVAR